MNVNAMICRNCGAGLEADKIDRSLRVITCSHCGGMHDMPDESVQHSAGVQNSINSKTSSPKLERQEVPLPNRFKVNRTPQGLEITWRVGRLLEGLVLLIVAGGFTYVAMMQGLYFLIAVSVGLVYTAAVRTFNEHRIRTGSNSLQVTQGPLPWLGARKLDVSDIAQLFSTEYETRIQTGGDGDRRTEVHKRYYLSAQTKAQKRVKLLSGLADPLQALWLEQEIERSLGIRDERVAGEHWQ